MDEDLKSLSDDELLLRVEEVAANARHDLGRLLEHLAEMEGRELAERRAFPSLFAYCVSSLRFSEDEAYARIRVARAMRDYPMLLEPLRNGALPLSCARIIAPHLTPSNCRTLIEDAAGKSYRDVERLVAAISPPTKVQKEQIRYIAPAAIEAKVEPETLPLLDQKVESAPVPIVEPPLVPSPEARVLMKLIVSEETFKLIERVRALLWHKNPHADREAAILAGVTAYLERFAPERRIARTEKRKARIPKETDGKGRRVPESVKRAVWKRDGGRCAYVSADGHRCEETKGVEYDHIKPWALGGRSNDPANLRLLCRTHNQMLARETFGAAADFRA